MLCSRLCFWADDRGRRRMSSRLWGASHKVSVLLKGFLWEIDDHLRLKSLATSRKEVWDSFGVLKEKRNCKLRSLKIIDPHNIQHKCLELTVNDLEKLWIFFSFSLNSAYIFSIRNPIWGILGIEGHPWAMIICISQRIQIAGWQPRIL